MRNESLQYDSKPSRLKHSIAYGDYRTKIAPIIEQITEVPMVYTRRSQPAIDAVRELPAFWVFVAVAPDFVPVGEPPAVKELVAVAWRPLPRVDMVVHDEDEGFG